MVNILTEKKETFRFFVLFTLLCMRGFIYVTRVWLTNNCKERGKHIFLEGTQLEYSWLV